tara:strand:- start:323 stop:505 length:183 start_codon:yes stop_codon:yes gene_type:complete
MSSSDEHFIATIDKANDTKALWTALSVAWFVGIWSEQNFDLMVLVSMGVYIFLRVKQTRG